MFEGIAVQVVGDERPAPTEKGKGYDDDAVVGTPIDAQP